MQMLKNKIEAGDDMDTQMELMLRGEQFKKLLDDLAGEVRKKYDMKRAELEILYFLSKSGEQNTSTDIHYQLMMNRGHISQAVDSLCKRHFIIAIPDENDRRYVHYKVLETAKEIVEEIAKRREAINHQIFEGVTEEELNTFLEVSAKIKKNIENLNE